MSVTDVVTGWFRPAVSEVAREIAEEFESGQLIQTYLDPRGITELSVYYLGEIVTASWYPGWRTRSLDMGRDGFVGTDGDADFIYKAAKLRAQGLFQERLAALESKRRDVASATASAESGTAPRSS